jgi:hypothetical protein
MEMDYKNKNCKVMNIKYIYDPSVLQSRDDTTESTVMEERIKVLEDKVDLLIRELTKLERFVRDHEDYYDHRSLNE